MGTSCQQVAKTVTLTASFTNSLLTQLIYEQPTAMRFLASPEGRLDFLASSWLPPGGSWIFYQAALRNRLIKKTDETNYEKSSPNL